MDCISVVITVFNNIDYIKECIESVIHQTYHDIEIIIVDDGSTDGSGEICDEYAEVDSRIQVIHIDNKGAPFARKVGFSHTTGQYVSIIDSDDWLEVNMIESLYEESKKQNVDVVMCGRFEEYGEITKKRIHGIPAGTYCGEQLKREVYPRMMVNGDFFSWGIFPSFWDKLFKREVMIPHIYNVNDDIPMGNDAAGVYPILLNLNSIAILDTCYYHYRQNNTSMVRTSVQNLKQRKGFSLLYQSVLNALNALFDLESYKQQWLRYVLFLMIPRVDVLYDGIDKLPYLFPYKNVMKNCRVIIYGMGIFGRRFSKYLEDNELCTIVAKTDSDYMRLLKHGDDVISPNEIGDFDFDYILVTITYADAMKNVKKMLSQKVEEKKIQLLDIDFISQPQHLKALGLM